MHHLIVGGQPTCFEKFVYNLISYLFAGSPDVTASALSRAHKTGVTIVFRFFCGFSLFAYLLIRAPDREYPSATASLPPQPLVRCLPCQVGLSSRWLPTNHSSAYAPALALARAICEPSPKIGSTIALSSRQRDESHHPRLHVDIARDGSVRQVAVERDAVR